MNMLKLYLTSNAFKAQDHKSTAPPGPAPGHYPETGDPPVGC